MCVRLLCLALEAPYTRATGGVYVMYIFTLRQMGVLLFRGGANQPQYLINFLTFFFVNYSTVDLFCFYEFPDGFFLNNQLFILCNNQLLHN